MRWTSALAIYVLFWALSVFVVLPFGVRTHEEAGVDRVPGQADSAPAHFDVRKLVVRTTIVSAILFGLFYANYVNGWVQPQDVDFFTPPNEN
jgi:predicted secreted protein